MDKRKLRQNVILYIWPHGMLELIFLVAFLQLPLFASQGLRSIVGLPLVLNMKFQECSFLLRIPRGRFKDGFSEAKEEAVFWFSLMFLYGLPLRVHQAPRMSQQTQAKVCPMGH